MAKRKEHFSEQVADGIPLELKYEGDLAEQGQMPAAELADALQGWDKLFQLGYYAHEKNQLTLFKAGTDIRISFHIRRISKGSFLVDALIWTADAVGQTVVGAGGVAFLIWTRNRIKQHICAKREAPTLDAIVDAHEALAKEEQMPLSQNRKDTEDFVTALDAALKAATTPLDSSAVRVQLSVHVQGADIELDRRDRKVILMPFEPPQVDPEAEPLIAAAVRFIRINRKTRHGLMSFVRPTDESQLGTQRFHCADKSMQRKGNQYTGAFHRDEPLVVRMQRKAYERNRRGHYWLIVEPVDPTEPTDDSQTLFT